MSKIFVLNNPNKPPAYVRLYTNSGAIISEFKIENFDVLQQRSANGKVEMVIAFDATEIQNLQPSSNNQWEDDAFLDTRPGAALQCISYSLTEKAKAGLTVNRLPQAKTTKPAKRWWHKFMLKGNK